MRRKPWWLVILVFLCASGCIRVPSGQAGYGDKIRVLVLNGISSLNIKNGTDTLKIRKEVPGTVLVNGREKSLPLRFYPDKEFIYLNGRPYRGAIEVLDGKKGLLVVNELFLELYLIGIINNEISSKWPKEVIKSQAVIARTYAVYQKKRRLKDPYNIEGSVMGQVYNGVTTEDSSAARAVKETAGEILTYGGEPALTVYHSNAGGMTDSSKDIWSHYYPYLNAVKSPYDASAPGFNWEFTLASGSLKDILSSSGYNIERPEAIYLEDVTASGRVKTLIIKDSNNRTLRLSGEDLRKIIGYSTLKSAIFGVSKNRDLFTFKGRGSGHGVGLSQWGAKGMAENGYSYREILSHYYPGTTLDKAY